VCSLFLPIAAVLRPDGFQSANLQWFGENAIGTAVLEVCNVFLEHITGDADNEGITAHGVSNLFGSRPVLRGRGGEKHGNVCEATCYIGVSQSKALELTVHPAAVCVKHRERKQKREEK
jgi:hypothetical protein